MLSPRGSGHLLWPGTKLCPLPAEQDREEICPWCNLRRRCLPSQKAPLQASPGPVVSHVRYARAREFFRCADPVLAEPAGDRCLAGGIRLLLPRREVVPDD